MRVEAELVGGSVDEAAWELPVEWRLGREGAMEERRVRDRLRRRDERLGPPDRTEERRVDTGRRGEARPRHPPDEAELVPRSPRAAEHRRRPDRGALRCQPPLHDRVELGQLHVRLAQEVTQNPRARSERQVRENRERLVRQAHDGRVALHHLHARVVAEAGVELLERCRVELDRPHAGPRVGEGACQDAAAGAEVEHERPGRDAGVADELVCEGATTKSVATMWPRLR